jgi:hypothetical protein
MRRMFVFGMVAAGVSLAQIGCKSNGLWCSSPQPGTQSGPIVVGPGPGAAPVPQGGTQWLPEPPVGPAPIGSQSSSNFPNGNQKDIAWKSALGPSVRLYPPENGDNLDSNKKIPLRPPEVVDAEKPISPKAEAEKSTKEPPLLPVGIPRFALVREKVANGLRPSLDDGLGWLQANGYRTVLFLHEPGSPESVDRLQVEKRGMRFLALEVSPMTLSQKTIDDFNRIVGDSAGLPLFVYDTDGSLTGGLWYAHFRQTHGATEESARKHASQLGFREEGEITHRQMWQAVQKLMSER